VSVPTPDEIRNRHGGLCLDACVWATSAGSEVRQWTRSNGNAQHWRIS